MFIAFAAVAIPILYAIGRANRPPDLVGPLQDSLHVLRIGADSCRADLERGQTLLNEYDERLDSMRARVRRFESLDRRGVPADSYDVYLGAFDQYNDSVGGWSARTDTLRARLQRCRTITETHNVMADSLRRLLTGQMQQ
jgi:hypothetical protein